MYIVFGKAV